MNKKYVYFLFRAIMVLGLILTACSNKKDSEGKGTSRTQTVKRSENEKEENYINTDNDTYITADTTIEELLLNSVLGNFAFQILPWDDRDYDMDMKMSEISSLLPYHTHVDTDTVVAPLNHMMDDIKAGNVVFYNIYSEEEKQSDPSKENTGIFFFRGEENAPFAVVNAGGGFSYVGSLHEGFPYALEISNEGYNAFVLKYRTGSADVAVEDLATAITFIFEHADELRVDTENYSLWGSSAGARMVAYIGTYGVAGFDGDNLSKPSTVVMAYTGLTDYSTTDPATIVVVGENDGIANPKTMERRINALRNAGIPTEFHKYPGLSHGFGLGIGTSAEGWVTDAVEFWKEQME